MAKLKEKQKILNEPNKFNQKIELDNEKNGHQNSSGSYAEYVKEALQSQLQLANFDGLKKNTNICNEISHGSQLHLSAVSGLNPNVNENPKKRKRRSIPDMGCTLTDKDLDLNNIETEMQLEMFKGKSIADAVKVIMKDAGEFDGKGMIVRSSNKKKKHSSSIKKNNNRLTAVKNDVKLVKNIAKTPETDSNLKKNKQNKKDNLTDLGKEDSKTVRNSSTSTISDNLENNANMKKKSKKTKVVTTTEAEASHNTDKNKQLEGDKFDSSFAEKTKTDVQMLERKSKKKNKIPENLLAAATAAEEARESKSSGINAAYTSKSFRKQFKRTWKGKLQCDMECNNGGELLQKPFNVARLPDFVTSSSHLLVRLRKQLEGLPMREKNNDMYKFHQSDELPDDGACGEVREFLQGTVKDWLSSLTGIQLNDKLALSASLYKHTDTLVCHDDELEGRRIAFILYLTEHSWGPQDGGSLDIFSVDDSGRPDRVVKRLYPQYNSFAFFEVSPVSFHQVAEVINPREPRLSINGWFHGCDVPRPPRPSPPVRHYAVPGHVQMETVYEWINPLYLAESLQSNIRSQFKRDSEIQLDDFIPEGKYNELCAALTGMRCEDWQWAGPPNRLHYQICRHKCSLPPALQQFMRVMRSEAVMLVLAQLSGLPLHPLCTQDTRDCSDDDDDDEADSEKLFSDDEEQVSREEQENNSDIEHDDSNDSTATLKDILKKHRKAARKLAHDDTRSNGDNSGIEKPWTPDVGVYLERKSRKSAKKTPKEDGGGTDESENGQQESSTTKGLGSVFCSVRKMSHGCYSVILDDDNLATGDDTAGDMNANGERSSHNKIPKDGKLPTEMRNSFVLDVAFYCNVPEGWNESMGGYTAYVAKGEAEELLSIVPRCNSLALVYRDHQTFGFNKHVNCSSRTRQKDHATVAGSDHFHQIFLQYK
uniref:uS12 prolyl 3-hydroxylase n=1 Tax=Hirondellea gigas TaxID=1518452 RepID=A0A2P2I2T1_9CRUS